MLGAYQILGELGRGGMGAVFRARTADGRDVAIKVLLNARRALAVDRFARERRPLGALGEADGFVPPLDGGVGPQGPFLVMPFLAGGTLRDKLDRGPLAIDETVALGIALARACGKAHERG